MIEKFNLKFGNTSNSKCLLIEGNKHYYSNGRIARRKNNRHYNAYLVNRKKDEKKSIYNRFVTENYKSLKNLIVTMALDTDMHIKTSSFSKHISYGPYIGEISTEIDNVKPRSCESLVVSFKSIAPKTYLVSVFWNGVKVGMVNVRPLKTWRRKKHISFTIDPFGSVVLEIQSHTIFASIPSAKWHFAKWERVGENVWDLILVGNKVSSRKRSFVSAMSEGKDLVFYADRL